jgi:hypothetical protein
MLKRKYATQAEIPAGFESLYKEQDGAFVRDDSQIEGAGGDSSAVTNVQKALNAERQAHKATKDKLAAFGELSAEDAVAAVTERDELKLKLETAGKPDDGKIAELVKARVAIERAPLDKKINDLTKERDTAVSERDGLVTARKRDRIAATINEKAVKAGVLKEAVGTVFALVGGQFDLDEGGKVVTREMDGVVPGLDVDQVINDLKSQHPYLWPMSQGGGATGGQGGATGSNPWRADNWNVTEQGRIVAKDPAKAKSLASAAGVDVNATEPKKV